jgi:hypothetical protein
LPLAARRVLDVGGGHSTLSMLAPESDRLLTLALTDTQWINGRDARYLLIHYPILSKLSHLTL